MPGSGMQSRTAGSDIEASRGLNVSPATVNVLSHHGLLVTAQEDRRDAASCSKLVFRPKPSPTGRSPWPSCRITWASTGQTRTPVEAMAWYRDAATLAALALGDPAASRPDLAVDIHNRAVARSDPARPDQARSRRWTIGAGGRFSKPKVSRFTARPCILDPERIGDLRVASDLQGRGHGSRLSLERPGSAAGRASVYRRSRGSADRAGPVLPARNANRGDGCRDHPGAVCSDGDWRRNPSTIDLLDPFQQQSIAVGAREAPSRQRPDDAAGDAGGSRSTRRPGVDGAF